MAIVFYDRGQLVQVVAEFSNRQTGAYVDPATVKLKIKKPDGASSVLTYGTDAAVVKDATGKYHADLSADMSGEWFYRWEGTGANQAATEDSFEVRTSQF